MISQDHRSIREEVSYIAAELAGRAVAFTLRYPQLRNVLIGKLISQLEASYEQYEDDRERLAYNRWLGRHLGRFLDRLIEERPNAAKAILRFLATWSFDVRRRTIAQRAGAISPATVVIEPTDRCNLRCPGCYANSVTQGSDLSFAKVERIVQEVVDLGVTLVTISGGEPLIREKSEGLLTRLARRHPDRGFLVYTNGTLFDRQIVGRFARAGNVFPAISVEGFEHQTDARRGRGIYQQNRHVRKLLAQRGVMTGFSATLTSENCESICSDDFIDLRIEEGDLFGWFFLLQPIGRSPRVDLMVTADQRAMLRDTINRWRSEDRPIFLGDFWNDGKMVGGCMAAGKYYFHIYANGDISPCVFSPIACGNVIDIIQGHSRYESLGDLVQNHPVFARYREEQDRITDRSRPCPLIDQPDAIRRICSGEDWRPARNMAPTYLSGEIAEAVDATARAWQEHLQAHRPESPGDLEKLKMPAQAPR